MTQTLNPATMSYDELVDAVNEADRLYYDDPDSATMPDSVYDAMYDRLVHIEKGGYPPLAIENIRQDSPTRRVQGSSTFAPTRHAIPMLSLDKVTTDGELAKFVATLPEGTELSVEPKLDGASLSLEFEDGKLVRAVTRGDGTTGDDVTENARLIRGVPSELTIAGEPFEGWVRGEVVIHLADLPEINERRKASGDKPLANTRNGAAGGLRHSDPREARRRRLTFYAYDSSDGHTHQIDGFLPYLRRTTNTTWTERGVRDFIQLRASGQWPFETDGIVIKVISHDLRAKLGYTGKHPKWAVAYKTAGDTAATILKSVTWQTGAGGAVTPVAELEPVYLGGTNISRATLHNPKFIADMRLFIGAPVEIRRMGDVIPGVVGVVPGESIDFEPQFIQTPTECPECGERLVQEGNSQQVKCPNFWDCTPQIVGRLVKWAGRDAADIDAIGPTWIETFVRAGLLRHPADFYKLTVDSIAGFEGMGDKRPQLFIDSIQKSKGIGMRRALIGFSIPMASEGTAKRLCSHFDSIEAISESCRIDLGSGGAERLKSIDDIGAVVANNIQEFFLENGQLVSDLRALGVDLNRLDEDDPVVKTATSKNFVVTGGFEGFSNRKEPVALLERAGWVSQSGISAKTDYLVTDDPNPTSSKAKKAALFNVEVITMAKALELAGVER